MSKIEELKALIGTKCMVIDPRSRKKEFEPGTIVEARVNIQGTGDSQYVAISYEVKLDKLTTKKSYRNEGYSYHRTVCVGGNRIKLNSHE